MPHSEAGVPPGVSRAAGTAAQLRRLPSVDALLAAHQLAGLRGRIAPAYLTDIARRRLAAARAAVAGGAAAPSADALARTILGEVEELLAPSPQPLINATGVVLHTNLGRALLSEAAIAAMAQAARAYSNLEYDLGTGARGSRHAHVEPLLALLTGAEAALTVNNNAFAVLLGLAALAGRREVIVSRGEAVEIGGGFRIPDVLRQSGARLVEVGTTNRTRTADYAEAITPRTAALLRVHASNFRIVGFTETPALADLARLAHERGVLLLDDLGSGCLLDTTQFGLAPEPRPQDALAAGVDLAFFSGDKLLGGPQVGIIVGGAEAVDRLRRHPLARALRLDKATLAALRATLQHYLRGEALAQIPVWRMISTEAQRVRARATTLATAIGKPAGLTPGESTIGGGSLPGETLPTTLVVIDVPQPSRLAGLLRAGSPAVVARVSERRLLLDLRTVPPELDPLLLEALRVAMARGELDNQT